MSEKKKVLSKGKNAKASNGNNYEHSIHQEGDHNTVNNIFGSIRLPLINREHEVITVNGEPLFVELTSDLVNRNENIAQYVNSVFEGKVSGVKELLSTEIVQEEIQKVFQDKEQLLDVTRANDKSLKEYGQKIVDYNAEKEGISNAIMAKSIKNSLLGSKKDPIIRFSKKAKERCFYFISAITYKHQNGHYTGEKTLDYLVAQRLAKKLGENNVFWWENELDNTATSEWPISTKIATGLGFATVFIGLAFDSTTRIPDGENAGKYKYNCLLAGNEAYKNPAYFKHEVETFAGLAKSKIQSKKFVKGIVSQKQFKKLVPKKRYLRFYALGEPAYEDYPVLNNHSYVVKKCFDGIRKIYDAGDLTVDQKAEEIANIILQNIQEEGLPKPAQTATTPQADHENLPFHEALNTPTDIYFRYAVIDDSCEDKAFVDAATYDENNGKGRFELFLERDYNYGEPCYNVCMVVNDWNDACLYTFGLTGGGSTEVQNKQVNKMYDYAMDIKETSFDTAKQGLTDDELGLAKYNSFTVSSLQGGGATQNMTMKKYTEKGGKYYLKEKLKTKSVYYVGEIEFGTEPDTKKFLCAFKYAAKKHVYYDLKQSQGTTEVKFDKVPRAIRGRQIWLSSVTGELTEARLGLTKRKKYLFTEGTSKADPLEKARYIRFSDTDGNIANRFVFLKKNQTNFDNKSDKISYNDGQETIRVAVIGEKNIGKSTMICDICQFERTTRTTNFKNNVADELWKNGTLANDDPHASYIKICPEKSIVNKALKWVNPQQKKNKNILEINETSGEDLDEKIAQRDKVHSNYIKEIYAPITVGTPGNVPGQENNILDILGSNPIAQRIHGGQTYYINMIDLPGENIAVPINDENQAASCYQEKDVFIFLCNLSSEDLVSNQNIINNMKRLNPKSKCIILLGKFDQYEKEFGSDCSVCTTPPAFPRTQSKKDWREILTYIDCCSDEIKEWFIQKNFGTILNDFAEGDVKCLPLSSLGNAHAVGGEEGKRQVWRFIENCRGLELVYAWLFYIMGLIR